MQTPHCNAPVPASHFCLPLKSTAKKQGIGYTRAMQSIAFLEKGVPMKIKLIDNGHLQQADILRTRINERIPA